MQAIKINNKFMEQELIKTRGDVDQIDELSNATPQIIFKHSINCNISADAYEELKSSDFTIHYLDLINNRDASNYIAEKYNVVHKSPQILIINKGKCVYHESHWKIKNDVINMTLDVINA